VDVYDFLLASNMISVGVDVGRLGAMIVAGQPKTNAEYIQATSRVGRNNPGIVITVYNSSRSRDRSHYEQFLKYHTAMYRYVEATSLTPFSDRARDRGLHALFVSLCRYLVSGLLRNDDAVNFDASDPKVREIERLILDYVKTVDPEELPYVKDELKIISDLWKDAAVGTLVYRGFKNEKSLLKGDVEDDRFRTMNSMRNVDGQAGIYLLGR
jgi:superfamily II DNA or RNA helicase